MVGTFVGFGVSGALNVGFGAEIVVVLDVSGDRVPVGVVYATTL